MNVSRIATVDANERTRATRVEVAKLQTLPYREPLGVTAEEIRLSLVQRHMMTLPLADRESILGAELDRNGSKVDWTVLDELWAQRAIELAVRRTQEYWGEKLSATEDDLTQSARIILAERAEKFRRASKPYIFLYQELAKLVHYEHRDASLDALLASDEARANRDESEVEEVWLPAPYVAKERR